MKTLKRLSAASLLAATLHAGTAWGFCSPIVIDLANNTKSLVLDVDPGSDGDPTTEDDPAVTGADFGTFPNGAGTAEQSMAINQIRSGAVVIAGSGMCTGGRIVHHLKHNIGVKLIHCMNHSADIGGSKPCLLSHQQMHIRICRLPGPNHFRRTIG